MLGKGTHLGDAPDSFEMTRSLPQWEKYERLIAQLIANQVTTNLCVTPNAKLIGRISQRKRQIDVLIDLRHNTDNSPRIIVDAKLRTRRVDVKEVEAFRGLMEDVAALVCPTGYRKAAERRAQRAVSVRLVPLEHLDDFDPATSPNCLAPRCRDGLVFWDGYPELSFKAVPVSVLVGLKPQWFSYVHYIGKYDRCGRFHVKCPTCGEIMAPPEDDESDVGRQCGCKMPWF
jgi:hypothetical protein